MKSTKLFAALVMAGLFGISDAEARSPKVEIRSLEKEKARYQEEQRETRDRLKELNQRGGRKTEEEDSEFEGDDGDEFMSPTEAREVRARKDRDVVRKCEAEAARLKAAEKKMARIERAIRKEKARERLEREVLVGGLGR